MHKRTIILIAAALLGTAGCSRSADAPAKNAVAPGSAAPVTPGSAAPAAPAGPPPPATLTDVNIAASDAGGTVEDLTGNYGPGLIGRRLIDGVVDPPWKVPATFNWVPDTWVKYPTDIVLSFFERQPALVGAVAIELPQVTTAALPQETSAAPKDVEVWTALEGVDGPFTKVASAAIEPVPGEQRITFPAVEARFVRVRVLSGGSQKELEIAEVRVLEAVRAGYPPLAERAPGVKFWKGSPSQAAQRGLEWLQQAANDWPKANQTCFGCHVQAQVLMGQAVALKQGYPVNAAAVRELAGLIRGQQLPGGGWPPGSNLFSVSAFGAMGLAYANEVTGAASDPALVKAVDDLLTKQEPDGGIPVDWVDPPIIQGQFMTTANAVVAIAWAARHSADPKYAAAAARGVAWIASHEPETTQDKVFKIVALMRYGSPDQKRIAWSVTESLAAEQQADGGWKEMPATAGSNAFATGQVLYAFKQAGISVEGAMFRRGVDFLLKHQVNKQTPADGSWTAMNTLSHRRSAFAPTMWAVIGLAGSYGAEPKGAVQVVRQQGDKPVTRNLEIVLDVSGSMNTRLGQTTRWQTALDVLKEVVGALPDDLTVGMRVYGHRYASRSAQTCQDTELIVPLKKLDRDRIVKAAAALRPRGETPLVRSVLQTVTDLKAVGGGSVILITDGEESCQGNAVSAARQIKASAVHVTLNIVGFTVTGQAVEAELGSLAASTGGRYYSAQDGAQLSRAVKLAALQRLPYDILDASGRVVVSGETSDLSRELPPGQYRVRIDALGQRLEESVTIATNQTTVVPLEVEGDHFVIRR